MAFTRSYPRTSDTLDLSARLLSPGCHYAARRVLNLSEGGMLVSGGELEVGEIARFELAGPAFRSSGVAEVAHQTPQATGLRFLDVDACDLRDLVCARVAQDHVAAAARTTPGSYLG